MVVTLHQYKLFFLLLKLSQIVWISKILINPIGQVNRQGNCVWQLCVELCYTFSRVDDCIFNLYECNLYCKLIAEHFPWLHFVWIVQLISFKVQSVKEMVKEVVKFRIRQIEVFKGCWLPMILGLDTFRQGDSL